MYLYICKIQQFTKTSQNHKSSSFNVLNWSETFRSPSIPGNITATPTIHWKHVSNLFEEKRIIFDYSLDEYIQEKDDKTSLRNVCFCHEKCNHIPHEKENPIDHSLDWKNISRKKMTRLGENYSFILMKKLSHTCYDKKNVDHIYILLHWMNTFRKKMTGLGGGITLACPKSSSRQEIQILVHS